MAFCMEYQTHIHLVSDGETFHNVHGNNDLGNLMDVGVL